MNATRLTRSVALLGALLQVAITASAVPWHAHASHARADSVALNPQPIPPGRATLIDGSPTWYRGPHIGPVAAAAMPGRAETAALNPQPIPPGRYGRSALNPQPIPPCHIGSGVDIPDPSAGPRPPLFATRAATARTR